MAEEDTENAEKEPAAASSEQDAAAASSGQPAATAEKGSGSINEIYFSNGNRLLTLPGSSLAVNDDTRRHTYYNKVGGLRVDGND